MHNWQALRRSSARRALWRWRSPRCASSCWSVWARRSTRCLCACATHRAALHWTLPTRCSSFSHFLLLVWSHRCVSAGAPVPIGTVAAMCLTADTTRASGFLLGFTCQPAASPSIAETHHPCNLSCQVLYVAEADHAVVPLAERADIPTPMEDGIGVSAEQVPRST